MVPELTEGQKLAGVSFNPSENKGVDTIKQRAADLIDAIIANTDVVTDPAAQSFVDKSVADVVSAQMFAVKAITWESK